MVLPIALMMLAPNAGQVGTPGEALGRLKAGNVRSLTPAHHTISNEPNRAALALSQEPYAVVLGCSDSRVPPEILFDEGPGTLFVVRVAGNIVDAPTLGSVEYGVEHLHAKVVLVLGHASCGAISASMEPESVRETLPINIQFLLNRISTDGAKDARAATIANVRHQLSLLNADPVLQHEVAAGKVKMVGGFVDISTGKVEFLD
jgi:carbonic anhydrase